MNERCPLCGLPLSRHGRSVLACTVPVLNAFCPTGEGGGVDPSCGGGEGGGTEGGGGAKLDAAGTAGKLKATVLGWIEQAREDYEHGKGKAPTHEEMERTVADLLVGQSPHKVAKELGLVQKFKNKDEAVKAIRIKTVGRVGAFARTFA